MFDPGLVRAAFEDPAAREGQREAAPANRLSRIELDLLRLMAAGLTNRQIAQHLRWSHATVKKYVQRVLEKLDVSDRTQASVEAIRRGLLE